MDQHIEHYLNVKEKYFVKANLSVGFNDFNDIPCKIFLSENIEDKPCLILKPDTKQFHVLSSLHKFSLSACLDSLLIHSPSVFFVKSQSTYWGDGLDDSYIEVYPEELSIKRNFKTEDSSNACVIFWITPNYFITPRTSLITSYQGTIECDYVEKSIVLLDNINIEIEKYFYYEKSKEGYLTQKYKLAIHVDLEGEKINANYIKNDLVRIIDDFLLLVSFISTQKCICVGWHLTESSGFTDFYRGSFVFPKIDKTKHFRDALIEPLDYNNFFEKCYLEFKKIDNQAVLRDVIHALVPSNSHTIEASYLNSFAGLEALVLDFRRKNDLEFVLNENDWKALRKYLEKSIKQCEMPSIPSKKRASLYNKLSELNRVSLEEAMDAFFIAYDINVSDLWPIFRKRNIAGLSEIRNKVIHGDLLPQDVTYSLVTACAHLECVLQRCLFSVLRWDINKTKVHYNCFEFDNHMKQETSNAQKIMADYFDLV